MISDARGGHVSPGIYTEEKDVTYSVKSLGITSLGLVGETLYGPAFENIEIENWGQFVDYFGGTSPEKFRKTGLPKYELPYIAKSYLEESKRLNVVRVLGLSGYHAGPAWVLSSSSAAAPVVVLRSLMCYEYSENGICEGSPEQVFTAVTDVKVVDYAPKIYTSECVLSAATQNDQYFNKNEKFGIEVTASGCGFSGKYVYNVSLNPADSDYIYKVLSSDPSNGTTPVYIDAVYENSWDGAMIKTCKKVESENIINESGESESVKVYDDFLEMYRPGQTPWIVSDVAATSGTNVSATMRKLFKFVTISDGDAANYQVKVSIQNIKPDEGTFDVVVRDFNDDDAAPVILEKFSRCSLVEGDASYIAFKIGTVDGGYASKSKYIAVEMAEGDDLSNSIPAGFLGYPMPKYGSNKQFNMKYYTKFDASRKPKRQYFGLNREVIDSDVLSYKGRYFYDNKGDANPDMICNGFHMDSIISKYDKSKVIVDGASGYVFSTVSAEKVGSEEYEPRLINARYLNATIYKDINLRKFTVYFYGGFDGWDVNRGYRTNTDEYKASRYSAKNSGNFSYVTENGLNESLNLPATAITTDYYAYLAGFRRFANPQDVEINLFATPGIDWFNNTLLTEEAIDVIEDSDDGRGGDALYIMAAPMELSPEEVVEAFNDTEIDSSYAATYYPWVMYYDNSNKKYLHLPVTKDVVRNMAATDNNSFPWFAPAGTSRGPVKCIKADHKTTITEEDVLYEGRINPVKSFAQDGVKIWGNKTAYSQDSPLNRINVRRLMIRVKKLVSDAAKHLIFEQYDDTLEKQFRGLVEPILADVKANRGIYDYRVQTEVTAETRDQHILPAKILIKPTPALEYISISFVVYPESVNFEEN